MDTAPTPTQPPVSGVVAPSAPTTPSFLTLDLQQGERTTSPLLLRVCNMCRQPKPSGEFKPRSSYPGRCHDCSRASKLAWERKYRQEHSEQFKAYSQAWHATEQGRLITNDQRRRRRSRLASVESEPFSRTEIINRDHRMCHICGKLVEDDLELDHLIPISQGGPDTRANVKVAHRECNRRKGATGSFSA